MNHKQVWVRVNTQVDEKIKPLIEAMSLFAKLRTIESCQGEPAWVCFSYGDSWNELADFVCGYFGKRLMEKFGDRVSVSIHIEENRIQGELNIRPGMITATTADIKQLARTY